MSAWSSLSESRLGSYKREFTKQKGKKEEVRNKKLRGKTESDMRRSKRKKKKGTAKIRRVKKATCAAPHVFNL